MNRTIQPSIVNATDFSLYLKPYQHFKLHNNLPVFAVHAGKEEVIEMSFVFFAGNAFEEKNLTAAATNFLLKNGTHQKTAYEINEHFDYHGAFIECHCYNETASITLHCLTKHLPLLLPVIAEMITEATFPQEEIDIYKKNALQKLKINLTKSDFVANRLIDEYLYGFHHPYGKYSTKEAIEAIDQNTLQAFYQNFYQNGNCLLFIAGHLPSDIHTLLNANFGTLPFRIKDISTMTFHYQSTPSTEHKKIIVNDENATQGAIRIARIFPNRHHPDFIKAQVMNTIFGGYFGSRLMSNIREDKGYTYGIHSFIQNHLTETALVISTEAGKDVCASTIEEVWKEAKLMQEKPVFEDELLLVKNYLIGAILADIDGPFQIMARWKNYILHQLDNHYFYEYIQTIKNMTAEDIQTMAQKYLHEADFKQLTVY